MHRRRGARTHALLPIGLFFLVWSAATSLFAPLEALISILCFFLGTAALVGIAAVRRGDVVRRVDGSGRPAPVAIIGLSTLSAACATVGMFGLSMSAVAFGRGASPAEMLPYAVVFVVAAAADAVVVGHAGYRLMWVRSLALATFHAVVPFVLVGFLHTDQSMLALVGACLVASCWHDMRPESPPRKPRQRVDPP